MMCTHDHAVLDESQRPSTTWLVMGGPVSRARYARPALLAHPPLQGMPPCQTACAANLGTNASHLHELQTRAAEPSLRHEVTEVLDAMVATGLTVLRTWAFNDGEAQWNALQPRPGAHSLRKGVAEPALVTQPTLCDRKPTAGWSRLCCRSQHSSQGQRCHG